MSNNTDLRPIEGFPGYFVSRDGRVFNKSRELLGSWSKGYRRIGLMRGGKRVFRFVHTLVCEAFNGPGKVGQEVRHLDGNKLNNSAENLAWGTRKENASDRLAHGTQVFGLRVHGAKLAVTDVIDIRRRSAEGARTKDLAAEYGMTPPAVRAIARGEKRVMCPGPTAMRKSGPQPVCA